jgi:hypothetical protein
VHTKEFPLGEIRGQLSAGEADEEGWSIDNSTTLF